MTHPAPTLHPAPTPDRPQASEDLHGYRVRCGVTAELWWPQQECDDCFLGKQERKSV